MLCNRVDDPCCSAFADLAVGEPLEEFLSRPGLRRRDDHLLHGDVVVERHLVEELDGAFHFLFVQRSGCIAQDERLLVAPTGFGGVLEGYSLNDGRMEPLQIGILAALTPLEFDLLAETWRRTSIGDARVGSAINLERSLAVGDRIGGLIQRIGNSNGGGHDLQTLSALMLQLKRRFPDKTEATLLAEPNTPYDSLVQVMDAVRSSHTVQGAKVTTTELFPNISIGDAPVRTAR